MKEPSEFYRVTVAVQAYGEDDPENPTWGFVKNCLVSDMTKSVLTHTIKRLSEDLYDERVGGLVEKI